MCIIASDVTHTHTHTHTQQQKGVRMGVTSTDFTATVRTLMIALLLTLLLLCSKKEVKWVHAPIVDCDVVEDGVMEDLIERLLQVYMHRCVCVCVHT
jgi:predicted transcriptional regulator